MGNEHKRHTTVIIINKSKEVLKIQRIKQFRNCLTQGQI